MNLRFKTEAGENKFPHILNGSGTALARLFVALIETHQQADGSVLIPQAAAAVFENRPDYRVMIIYDLRFTIDAMSRLAMRKS